MVYVMRRTNIYLDDADLQALRSVGDMQNRPVAELVREAVAEWLEKHGVQRVGDDEWQRRLGELLDERRAIAKAADWDPDEVDRDVFEAIREVREARAARRR
jgi:hypothetical protein